MLKSYEVWQNSFFVTLLIKIISVQKEQPQPIFCMQPSVFVVCTIFYLKNPNEIVHCMPKALSHALI